MVNSWDRMCKGCQESSSNKPPQPWKVDEHQVLKQVNLWNKKHLKKN